VAGWVLRTALGLGVGWRRKRECDVTVDDGGWWWCWCKKARELRGGGMERDKEGKDKINVPVRRDDCTSVVDGCVV
jgi:hypothetical protein